jgi:hypothetical protein
MKRKVTAVVLMTNSILHRRGYKTLPIVLHQRLLWVGPKMDMGEEQLDSDYYSYEKEYRDNAGEDTKHS